MGRFGTRIITAPVLACTLVRGPRQPGEVVLHSCDNKACCAPDHLRWGSTAENNAEAWGRGRQASGERHHRSKLTDAQVAEVVRRAHAGERVADLANEFDAAESTIYYWLRGDVRRVGA
jgi:hypothetical protein